MREKNVGIIGCGFVANGHLKAWRKTGYTRVVVVTDSNEALARNTAELWKIPRYYTSFSNMLKHGDLDVIDICTPPETHASLAVEAMKTGHNVLIEKPMSMTLKDAEEIVRCQETTNMKACVIHNWLFEPPVLEATSLVEKRCLGEVTNVNIEALSTKYDSMAANEHHWCHSLPGGRFSEMLAHPIYLIRHFLGEVEIGNVQVSKIGEYGWMQSDELCATLKAGNKFGRVYVSFNAPREAIHINLCGGEAILKLDIINATVNMLPKRETGRFSKGFDSFRQAAQLIKSTAKNIAKIASGRWLSGHEMCINLFAQSLSSNSEIPVTVEDGYNVVKSLEEMCNRIEMARVL